MTRNLRVRASLLSALIGGLLSALARGDEMQYLPGGVSVVYSLDFQNVLKSKTLAELKNLVKEVPEIKGDIATEIVGEMAIPASNIARITMGLVFKERPSPKDDSGDSWFGIATTVKPVTAAEIIATRKPTKFKKNVTYKEIKFGKFTLHEEHFRDQVEAKDQVGKVHIGSVFCVREEKIVLFTDSRRGLDSLQKSLEREAKPRLSKNLQAGSKYADFTNTGDVVIDMQALPVREKERILRTLGMDALQEMADDLQVLAVKASEKDKFMGQATFVCKDADSATKAKKAVENSLAALKATLRDDPRIPQPLQDALKAAREGLDAVKVSVNANEVTATLNVAPEMAAKLFFTIFAQDTFRTPPPAKKA
jgi:hypothetical protein